MSSVHRALKVVSKPHLASDSPARAGLPREAGFASILLHSESTVNIIKKRPPENRGGRFHEKYKSKRSNFVNLVGIRVNDMDTAGDARIEGVHRS